MRVDLLCAASLRDAVEAHRAHIAELRSCRRFRKSRAPAVGLRLNRCSTLQARTRPVPSVHCVRPPRECGRLLHLQKRVDKTSYCGVPVPSSVIGFPGGGPDTCSRPSVPRVQRLGRPLDDRTDRRPDGRALRPRVLRDRRAGALSNQPAWQAGPEHEWRHTDRPQHDLRGLSDRNDLRGAGCGGRTRRCLT